MIKICIVDDDFHYRVALKRIFENPDTFILTGAFTSEEAVPHLLIQQPDVVILDDKLNALPGISLIKALRLNMPNTQFLICIPRYDDGVIISAITAGASGYILKNMPAQDIKKTIIEVYNRGITAEEPSLRNTTGLFQPVKFVVGDHRLSEREVEVLILISKGLLYKEIARALLISINTVKNHLKSVYKKMGVQNKTEAINKYKANLPFLTT
jgi:NarL family two-component system response regulator LiaR